MSDRSPLRAVALAVLLALTVWLTGCTSLGPRGRLIDQTQGGDGNPSGELRENASAGDIVLASAEVESPEPSSATAGLTESDVRELTSRPETGSSRVGAIVALWQEATGSTSDGLPTRGFAGQLMFFDAREKQPVEADGTVQIYLFDDFNDDPTQPVHVLSFVGGSWEKYRRDTKLGTTYQVFVPYPEARSREARCSLRVRFENAVSRVVSEPARVVLAGTAPDRPEPVQTHFSHRVGQRPADVPNPHRDATDTRLDRLDAMLARLQDVQPDQREALAGTIEELRAEHEAAKLRRHIDEARGRGGRFDAAVRPVAYEVDVEKPLPQGEREVRRGSLKVYSIPIE